MVICLVASAAYAQKARIWDRGRGKGYARKTVAAIKADKAKALAMINKGEGGFRDRDLYPACSGSMAR